MSELAPGPETRTFACPRCKTEVTEKFYGPCRGCRLELRADAAEHDFSPRCFICSHKLDPDGKCNNPHEGT